METNAESEPIEAGLRLVAAPAEDAAARARALAARRGRTLTIVPAAALAAAGEADAAEAMRCVLRDAVCYVERRMARVFEGHLVAVKPLGTPAEAGVPAARVAVTLQAAEDSRVIHLEGPWAWNLAASGAASGDVVQIARDAPFVTRRPDRTEVQGRVLDERDLLLRLRLGALDQAHAAAAARTPGAAAVSAPAETTDPTPVPADPDEEVLLAAARVPEILLATGERPPTGPGARRATDEWLRRRLAGPQARLEPGVLLVLAAADLPALAAAALEAALTAPGAPVVVLADADEEGAARSRRRFGAASTR